ncbi:3-oxoacid CoA-transferase subunit A [Gammaproteobacteria bacterium]|nr:3-oxoacid CoA-transferase subunit A [Gammaproteobacteria bacterium]
MNKKITVEDAAAKIKDGMTVMMGGFLANGGANRVIDALLKTDVKDLTIICNDTSYDAVGLGQLFAAKKIKKVIASYIGANKASQQQMNDGEIQVEFVPQGTLAERVRCGGCGLGGVLTQTGLNTIVEEGKQKIEVAGKEYILETALHADVALVGASLADESGNLVYYGTSQNFNPLMAMAADVVVAEVDKVVKVGEIAPEVVRTPAACIDFMVYPEEK